MTHQTVYKRILKVPFTIITDIKGKKEKEFRDSE